MPNSNLIVGYETGDDAAVLKVRDDLALVQSLDFFMPIVDDPFVFGQIAAANSLSDIYAMGAEPILNSHLGIPLKKYLPISLQKSWRVVLIYCHKAGVPLAGGHSIDDAEPKFGLSVTGTVHPLKVWKNKSAQVGDVIVLTKPLGVGVLGQGNKREYYLQNNMMHLWKRLPFKSNSLSDGLDVGINAIQILLGLACWDTHWKWQKVQMYT